MPFPTWFLWALIGHLANGAAFIIDKTLLRGSFKHPATYAGIIGCIGILALFLLPFGVHLPTPIGWAWSIASGVTFVAALWMFFAALAKGEASRIVPIIGSLIPILTLAGTSILLGERLTRFQLVGFALLIIATIILSGGRSKGRVKATTLHVAMLSAFLFAISSISGKISYDTNGFLTAFTISRLAGVVTALAIIVFERGALDELAGAFGLKKSHAPKHHAPLFLAIIGQTLGGLGFVGVQYATSIGSAALVNSLQAVQYALLVIVALALNKAAPDLLGEDLTRSTIIRKTVAIAIVGVGLWFVV